MNRPGFGILPGKSFWSYFQMATATSQRCGQGTLTHADGLARGSGNSKLETTGKLEARNRLKTGSADFR